MATKTDFDSPESLRRARCHERSGLWRATAMLVAATGLLAVTAIVLAPAGHASIALLATLACGSAMVGALWATVLAPSASTSGPLLGIGLRTLLPMAVGLCGEAFIPGDAAGAWLWSMLPAYLGLLTLETTLAAWLLSPRLYASRAASAGREVPTP